MPIRIVSPGGGAPGPRRGRGHHAGLQARRGAITHKQHVYTYIYIYIQICVYIYIYIYMYIVYINSKQIYTSSTRPRQTNYTKQDTTDK